MVKVTVMVLVGWEVWWWRGGGNIFSGSLSHRCSLARCGNLHACATMVQDALPRSFESILLPMCHQWYMLQGGGRTDMGQLADSIAGESDNDLL